jgi:hypothetical protein
MAPTTRVSDFLSSLSGRAVSVQALAGDAAARARLEQAGASVESIRQADADGDGFLSTEAEKRAVFKYADGFDRNGDAGSLISADDAGRATTAGTVLEVVLSKAQVAAGPGVRSRDEAYQRFLAQSRREGANGDHLSFLDRGISSSPYRGSVGQVQALFAKRPDGVALQSGAAAGATPFPNRGQRAQGTQSLPFLGSSTKQASVAVLTENNGAISSRWYGRDQDTNAPFWSASKSANALALISAVNTKNPNLKVGDLRVREAGQPGTAISLRSLFQDIASYDAGVPRSNAGAGLLGRLVGNAGRSAFVEANTGHAVGLNGNYGAGTIFNQPELVNANGEVVYRAPTNPGTPARNRISAADLTRLHAQAAMHARLSPEQRISGAQSHSLEPWLTAMAEDTARYADVAIEALGLKNVLKDVAISSKLGFGFEEGVYELAYSGVLQFADSRSTPPTQRAMSFTLRGENSDPVALDSSIAADMTELIRRLASGEL